MENIEFRQYRASDHDAVLQLHFKGLEQVGVRLSAELVPGLYDDLTRIEQEYLNGGDFLIATIGKEIVGMGAFRRIDDQTAEIKRMRVEPAYQSKGIGGLILDDLIKKAKAAGYWRLILDTNEKMQVARHLYQNRGFREYKRRAFGDIMIVYYTMDLN
jgi:GNAT superfamily N-acetyltransferase